MLKKMFILSAVIVLLGAGCSGNWSIDDADITITSNASTKDFLNCQKEGGTSDAVRPRQCKKDGKVFFEEDTGTYRNKTDVIVLADWLVNPVMSPVEVHGEARAWYFEGSFPVTVETASGTVVGSGIAQAQGDWMTDQFVPFTATVTFSAQPAYTLGYLVFHKDNPSGLPANDDSMSVPITFGN